MRVMLFLLLFVTLEARRNDAKRNLKDFDQTHWGPLTNNDIRQTKGNNYRYPFLIPVILKEIDPANELNKAAFKTRIFKRSDGIYTKNPNKSIDKPLGFLTPRDKLLYEEKYKQNKFLKDAPEFGFATQNFSRMSYDFEYLLERNLANSNPIAQIYPRTKIDDSNDKIQTRTESKPKWDQKPFNSESFADDSFFLKSMVPAEEERTTCDEFAKKALFHPNDVVNIDWIPFYKWSKPGPGLALVYNFEYPTKKRVQEYKEKYGRFVNNIDWKQPKLLMITNIQMLLIAGDRKGLFYGIPDADLPLSMQMSNITLEVVKIRLKILDPYLALMYCEERYAIILAILGEEPQTNAEKEKEAAILRFKGKGRPMYRDLELEEEMREAAFQKKNREEQEKFVAVQMQRENNPGALITRF